MSSGWLIVYVWVLWRNRTNKIHKYDSPIINRAIHIPYNVDMSESYLQFQARVQENWWYSSILTLRPRRTTGVISSLIFSPKAGKNWCLSSKDIRQSSASFVLCRPSPDGVRPSTLGRPSPLLSLLIYMLISSRNALTDTPKIIFD